MNGLVKEGSIGAILFQSHIISEEELRAALEEQKASGGRVGEALIRLGIVTQEDIDWALSNQLNIPYVRLKPEGVDPQAVAKVPAALARRYQLFPVFLSGDSLSVAMADPLNKDAVRELCEVTGCGIDISVGLVREIREMQDIFYGPAEEIPELGFTSPRFSAKALESINADLSAGALLNHLLLCVVSQKFTSLALQPMGDCVAMVARGNGRTVEIGRLQATHYESLVTRVKKLAKIEAGEAFTCAGLLQFLWQGKKIPFQAQFLGAEGGEYVTLKLQISAPPLTDLADLRLSESKVEDLHLLGHERDGLILFTVREPELRCHLLDLFLDSCETQGKTVLLLGERLGRGGRRFPRIGVQREGVDHTASYLSAALDHDPDLLMVEDVTETASLLEASKAALRGKLVLAGSSHPGTEGVLRQLFYLRERHFLMTGQLRGVVSCKSVLTLCPACKERYQPKPEELAAVGVPLHHREYFRPRGCSACDHTGYGGKQYLLDVIRFDPRLLDAFESVRRPADFLTFLKDGGYRGIAEEGAELLERGVISPAEFVAAILL